MQGPEWPKLPTAAEVREEAYRVTSEIFSRRIRSSQMLFTEEEVSALLTELLDAQFQVIMKRQLESMSQLDARLARLERGGG